MSTSPGTPAESGEYFYTPALKGLVQQLSHLAFFGDGISVVLGPRNSGKTMLTGELVREFAHAHAVATLALDEDIELVECIRNVSRSLGVIADEVDAEQSVGEMLAALRHYGQALEQDKKLVILLIDDAQRLDDQAVGALISLLQGRRETNCGLHLVLLSEPGLEARIDALQIVDVAVYDFEMPNFSPSELANFLEEEGRAEDEALNSSKLQKLWSASRGYPGIALANIRSTGGAGKQVEDARSLFLRLKENIPFAHVAAVLVLVLLLSYVIFSGGDEETQTTRESIVVPSANTTAKVKPASRATDNRATDGTAKDRATAATADETGSTLYTEEVITASPEVSLAPQPAVAKTDSETPKQSASDIAPEKVGSSREGTVEVNSSVVQAPTTTSSEPRETPAPVVETNGGIELTDQEAFLMTQNPEFFTLQVVAASKKASLDSYIKRQANRESLKLYRGTRAGKSWFVVVQGVYSTREMALNALKSLPEEQANAGPWPRKMSLIQQEIETFRRN